MDTTMHGFRLVSSSELKEIKGTADIYKHDKSGLTMVHLNCADTNKAFAMSFCTPPENSTGVPHILEHSVLAGSDKYPVREPFVDKGFAQHFPQCLHRKRLDDVSRGEPKHAGLS